MDYISAIALGITIIGAVWGHAIWLSNRFTSIYKDIDAKFNTFLSTFNDKLEYHERHDDRRFSEISNNLWEVRLQNALSAGKTVTRSGREEKEGGSQS